MSGPVLADRVKETSTTTGTGSLTLGGAVSGFRAFSDVLSNLDTVHYLISIGSEWEVGLGTWTTGGIISRDYVQSSSNGNSLVSLPSGQKTVTLVSPAKAFRKYIPVCGRLTTESGLPVSASDRTSQGTIYFTPHLGNVLPLWNGNFWEEVSFSEKSLILSGSVVDTNYDVFAYLSSGQLTLERLAWTSNTTRTVGLSFTDGYYTKSSDKSRLYLGSYRASGNGVTEDSLTKRFVWNAYNRLRKPLYKTELTASWTYTSNTWRQVRDDSSNRVETLIGLSGQSLVDVRAYSFARNATAGTNMYCGIGVNSVSSAASNSIQGTIESPGNNLSIIMAHVCLYPSFGYYAINWLERSGVGGTSTFFGEQPSQARPGLVGYVEA